MRQIVARQIVASAGCTRYSEPDVANNSPLLADGFLGQVLLFLEIPNPSHEVWAQLEEAHREAVLGKLAQLIAKTALSESQREENDND